MRTHMEYSDRQDRTTLSLIVAAATAWTLISAPARGAELGDARRGRDYAEAVCAQCHAVKPAEMTSPRLEATPFSVFAQAPGLNETALGVFLQTPHADMPNLIVSGQDRDDLIAYIIGLRRKQ